MNRSLILGLVALSVAGCGVGMDDASELGTVEAEARNQSYNCKRDKVVDTPALLRLAVAESPYRIHVEADRTGSDLSGTAKLSWYELTAADGTVTRATPQVLDNCPYGDDPTNFTFEPMQAGTRYQVRAATTDLCGNVGYSAPITVDTPAAAADTAGPVVSAPMNVRLFFFGPYAGVGVYASDDQQMDRVEFFVNGQPSGSMQLSGLHGWSGAQGEKYYVSIPQALQGQTIQVEAVAYDRSGNSTRVAGSVTVPVY